MSSIQTDRHPHQSSAQLTAFTLGQGSAQTHGTTMSGINSCPRHGVQLPIKNKIQVAKGRPNLCPTPPQDNQPFVVLFSAGSTGTVCIVSSTQCCRSTVVMPRGRAGGGRQGRSTAASPTGHSWSTIPWPPLSYLVSFQLQDMENPQSLIPATYRGQLRRRRVTQRWGDFQVAPAAGEPPAPTSHGGSEMGKRSKLAQEEVSNGSGGRTEAFLSLLSHEI